MSLSVAPKILKRLNTLDSNTEKRDIYVLIQIKLLFFLNLAEYLEKKNCLKFRVIITKKKSLPESVRIMKSLNKQPVETPPSLL